MTPEQHAIMAAAIKDTEQKIELLQNQNKVRKAVLRRALANRG